MNGICTDGHMLQEVVVPEQQLLLQALAKLFAALEQRPDLSLEEVEAWRFGDVLANRFEVSP